MTNPHLLNWHRTAPVKPRQPLPPNGGAYIPQMAERLERDPNLSDGARRCARVIVGYSHRRDRKGRTAGITITYLANALGRCRRTVQRYLRQLERSGYIKTIIVISQHSRLCTGLVIDLLAPLFPRHHRKKWPEKAMESGVTKAPQNYRQLIKYNIETWDFRCRMGKADAITQKKPIPASDYTQPHITETERAAIETRLRAFRDKFSTALPDFLPV